MDPFKLLSRSTNLSRGLNRSREQSTPSSGLHSQLQSCANEHKSRPNRDTKRKRRVPNRQDDGAAPDFFQGRDDGARAAKKLKAQAEGVVDDLELDAAQQEDHNVARAVRAPLSLEDSQTVLKQHKLKVTWLNPPKLSTKDRRKSKDEARKAKHTRTSLFPDPMESFEELRASYGLSNRLYANVAHEGYSAPTQVQIAGFPILLGGRQDMQGSDDTHYPLGQDQVDVLTVAPTGSGKTLTFLIPLIHNLQSQRRADSNRHHQTSAVILVPTKELAGQIVNEGRKLVKGTGIRITQMRKNMRLSDQPPDARVDTKQADGGDEITVVKADILVSTPGLMQSVVNDPGSSTSEVRHLILDETDVLLDPVFREQTLQIWNRLVQPRLRVSMWSATIGSNIEDLAINTINERRKRLALETGTEIAEAPLIRLVVGLKDSAVPNVQHKLIYAASEQGKLMALRQILHPTFGSDDSSPSLRPPFLVFTQTIERAIALHSELIYDIPPEAGGAGRIAVLHADLSDTNRDYVMTRFRKGEVWVLITTDLLSRGMDFLGVNGVVNYDLPGSSAAYVHRVGRTGRAGREGGVAVTLYGKEDIPYLKPVANVISIAQKRHGRESGMQQWLLDVLPNVRKNDKQNLKKRGIESRTARSSQKDPRAAGRARISTKAGFVRRAKNKRKGAIVGSQRRLQAELQSDDGDGEEFGGFDDGDGSL